MIPKSNAIFESATILLDCYCPPQAFLRVPIFVSPMALLFIPISFSLHSPTCLCSFDGVGSLTIQVPFSLCIPLALSMPQLALP